MSLHAAAWSGKRLDQYMSAAYPHISRGFLQKIIADGNVIIDGRPEKASYKLKKTDKLKILYDMDSIGIVPEIDIPIIYEDDEVLVIDKPAGVLSHALSKFHNEPSVASFLRQKSKPTDNSDVRFGIVHRLDRATSGVMVCAKTSNSMKLLQKQFSSGKVEKTYIAIVKGYLDPKEAHIDVPLERNPKAPATWRAGINGKAAQTHYDVLADFSKNNQPYSFIKLQPKTGRTHQLRVHMKHIGHPIVGDFLYSQQDTRMFLHAYQIKIELPGGISKTFSAPLPREFKDFLDINYKDCKEKLDASE